VFENRMLRRIFGYNGEAGVWRKIHNEELHNLFSSPNIIWVIKSGTRWAVHAARVKTHTHTYIYTGCPGRKCEDFII
jgi:hypothetical protein